MSSAAHQMLTYQCAHCKQVNPGEPVEIVLIQQQELPMCCTGCMYAAEMLAGFQANTMASKSTIEG